MSIISTMREQVEQKAPGSILTYRDFDVAPEELPAAIQSLSAFYRQGILQRITKGLYYKPEPTEFGDLPPSTRDLFVKLLAEQKERIAYPTGAYVYNALSLTTQVPMEYVIATDKPRTPIQYFGTKIHFIRARLKELPSQPLLAQLLDAIMDIRSIPGVGANEVAEILIGHLRSLAPARRQEMADISVAYPPSARAVLGVLLEQIGEMAMAEQINRLLNPTSRFQLGLDLSRFRTSLPWNIT